MNNMSHGDMSNGDMVYYIEPCDPWGNAGTGKVIFYGRLEKGIRTLPNCKFDYSELVNESPELSKKNWDRFSSNHYIILPKDMYGTIFPCYLSSLGYYNLIKYLIRIGLVNGKCHSRSSPHPDDETSTYYSVGYKLVDGHGTDYTCLCDWTEQGGLAEHKTIRE